MAKRTCLSHHFSHEVPPWFAEVHDRRVTVVIWRSLFDKWPNLIIVTHFYWTLIVADPDKVYDGTGCESSSYLNLPDGYQVASYSSGVASNVVVPHQWNASYLTFSNGYAYRTARFATSDGSRCCCGGLYSCCTPVVYKSYGCSYRVLLVSVNAVQSLTQFFENMTPTLNMITSFVIVITTLSSVEVPITLFQGTTVFEDMFECGV